MERSRAVQYRVGPKRRQRERDKPKGNGGGGTRRELAEGKQDEEIRELAGEISSEIRDRDKQE